MMLLLKLIIEFFQEKDIITALHLHHAKKMSVCSSLHFQFLIQETTTQFSMFNISFGGYTNYQMGVYFIVCLCFIKHEV